MKPQTRPWCNTDHVTETLAAWAREAGATMGDMGDDDAPQDRPEGWDDDDVREHTP